MFRFPFIQLAMLACSIPGVAFSQRPVAAEAGAESGSFPPSSCLPFSSVIDQVCAAENLKRSIAEQTGQREREMRARQEAHQREFKMRFNQLVDAVHGFAKQYNDGKGLVWPQREADELREAMRQLQSLEKTLRESSGSRRRNYKSTSSD